MICEKCWRDSGGSMDRYAELVDKRDVIGEICTPEEQAGNGDLCAYCNRNTVHQHAKKCMNPECEVYAVMRIRI